MNEDLLMGQRQRNYVCKQTATYVFIHCLH